MSTEISITQQIVNQIKVARAEYTQTKDSILATRRFGTANDADVLAARQLMTDTIENCIVGLMKVRHGLIIGHYAGIINASREEILAATIEADAAIQDMVLQFPDLVTAARNRFYS